MYLIRPQIHEDTRGFFYESYHQANLAELGIRDVFVQNNHSKSCRNTLRGLQYQLKHPQAKLCRVGYGKVVDVAVDIRGGSPYFGKWVSAILSAKSKQQILIPRGFAHGFVVLSKSAEFLYKCTDYYYPEDEHGVAWNDAEIGISWSVANPILFPKDRKDLPLCKVPREALPIYQEK